MSTPYQESWIQLLIFENERLRTELAEARVSIANLTDALDTNRDIGAALGVIMITHKITRDEAFDLLREVSQRSHRKLRDVASDVLYTGVLTVPPGRTPRAE